MGKSKNGYLDEGILKEASELIPDHTPKDIPDGTIEIISRGQQLSEPSNKNVSSNSKRQPYRTVRGYQEVSTFFEEFWKETLGEK